MKLNRQQRVEQKLPNKYEQKLITRCARMNKRIMANEALIQCMNMRISGLLSVGREPSEKFIDRMEYYANKIVRAREIYNKYYEDIKDFGEV